MMITFISNNKKQRKSKGKIHDPPTDHSFGACTICGIIFAALDIREGPFPRYLPEHGKWIWDAELLDMNEFLSSGVASMIPATNYGGPYYRGGNKDIQTWDQDTQQYAAFHPVCWKLAERVVTHLARFPTTIESGPSSMKELVKIYQNRDKAQEWDSTSWRRTRAYIQCPKGYYGAAFTSDADWGAETPGEKVATFWHCPGPIPGLTESIISYLQPMPEESVPPLNAALRDKISSLPPEIVEQVLSELPAAHQTISLECTRLLPPILWLRLLTESQLIPWLWDLDLDVLHRQEDGDWELLCRQLLQVDIFESGRAMEGAPLALRNRRRIWRLVEEARYGDCS